MLKVQVNPLQKFLLQWLIFSFSRYWKLACDGWVGVSAPWLREYCVQLICGWVDEMLACSECAFKGSGSGDWVTQAVDVLVLFSGCACKGSRSGDLVTLAVDGVEVQVFFRWQLTSGCIVWSYYQNHTDLERGTVTERDITSMNLKPEGV